MEKNKTAKGATIDELIEGINPSRYAKEEMLEDITRTIGRNLKIYRERHFSEKLFLEDMFGCFRRLHEALNSKM